ncbi:hypothetical protein [Mucilaginibacter sp.]|uniref:hypothetical protein n=1 Tax=Mucilaginibacter sp. TaxID=1882438 RepID=UPI0025FC6D09|nr:hypothetical protein [Mucilaginibacter sp.]
MSILAEKTDYRAIRIIARSLKLLQGLDNLAMTKTDDFELSLAKNMMKSVIDNNEQVMDISPSA